MRHALAPTHAVRQLSEHDISNLVERVEAMCGQLQQLGYAERVPQCQAVFNGSFEQQLRAELTSGGNAQKLLPGGVRLIK